MCSIQPGDEGTSAFVEILHKELTADKQVCTKCGLPAIIVLRTDDIYCRDCFLVRVTHRFRCEFGKSRLIRDKEPVLVAFSGGRNSCAMVHLIQEGLSKRAHKKLRFIPELIYIDDDYDSRGSVPQEREHFFSNLLTQLKETGLKYYIFTLEQVFDNRLCPVISNCNDETDCDDGDVAVKKLLSVDRSKLKMLMESSTTVTSQESLIFLLRTELLVRFAKKIQCGKIVLGDSASCLASRLMSSIVQGRGAQIPFEMGFADDRHGDVTFVRPMREFTEKEIDMYNTIINIRPIVMQERTEVRSLENLSKQFVSGLQAEHESTLAIICRTGEKLEMPDDEVKKMDRCVLCQAPNDNIVSSGATSAVSAMKFSHSIRHLLQEKTNTKQDSVAISNIIKPVTRTEATPEQSVAVGDMIGSNVKNNVEPRHLLVQLLSGLCYGCKLTVREMADIGKLPSSIILKAEEKSRHQIRQRIEEFLINDDDQP